MRKAEGTERKREDGQRCLRIEEASDEGNNQVRR